MGVAVEEVIREALQDGKFQALPGKGRPLRLDPSPDAVIKGILRDARYNPEWVEVAIRIDQLLAQAEAECERYREIHAEDNRALVVAQAASARAQPMRGSWWQGCGTRRRDTVRELTEALMRRRRLALGRYAALLHQADAGIRRFNLLVPMAHQQRVPLNIEDLLHAFLERFPRPNAQADDFEDVPDQLLSARATTPAASSIRTRHTYELLSSVRRHRRRR